MAVSIFSSPAGILKLVTVLLGAITIGLIGSRYTYAYQLYAEWFLSLVIILFIISTVLLILAFVDVFTEHHALCDAVYHIIVGVLLLVRAIIWFLHVGYSWGNPKSSYYHADSESHTVYIIAGVFTLLNSIIYVVIGVLVHKSRTEGVPQAL